MAEQMAHDEDVVTGVDEVLEGPKRESRIAQLAVVAGGEAVQVAGRAAELIAIIMRNAQRINTPPVGQVILSFAHDQTKGELRESLPGTELA